ADVINELDLHLYDYVFVEKGGEIIPKITGVDLSKRKPDSKKIEFVTHCPVCDTLLVRNEGEAAIYCPNSDNCLPQIKGRIEHFVSRKAMNIDSLGEETVGLLVDKGLVSNIADLYDLKYQDVLGVEKVIVDEDNNAVKKISLREKSSENIISAIEQSKNVPFPRVLFALGIRHVGETTAKKLAKHFINIDAIINSSFEELINCDEIGEIIANSIINYLHNPYNLVIIQRLKSFGLHFDIGGTINKQTPADIHSKLSLEGKTVVVSGVFKNFSREGIKEAVEALGGKIASSVSSKTDYIIAGDNMGPAKLQKANELNITVLSEDDVF
ncbi:MAG: helix-hairpin-helix domain-containing protein, partial [Bacteroidales bacterium]|nr:helix-hairpin-helix domain-containing protein [Bacteroidales bacterium]